MKIRAIIPKPDSVLREAVIVVAGAVIAAALVGAFPTLRDWIKKQWDGAPH
jgi:hypothetical protein